MTEGDGDVTYGLWLRRWRNALGLSRAALAEIVGCGQAMIKQIEDGSTRPSARLAARLAEALGAPLEARERIVDFARGQGDQTPLPLPNLAVAMAALTSTIGHVPAPHTRLIGRERELAALTTRLAPTAARLVTLTGLSGIGKTHLAKAAAIASQERFGHGAWFVELTGIGDPVRIARAIARVLGEADYGLKPIETQVCLALANRTLLLLLDDLNPSPRVADWVARLLAEAGNVTVLTTCPLPLGLSQEVVVPVQPLATPSAAGAASLVELGDVPAVALFVDRAQAASSEFMLNEVSAPAVCAITRRLGGHPVAIELAAAHLRVLSVYELAGRIERDAEGVLSGSGPRRQPGLQAAFEQAWESLAPKQQRALARLAIFPAGCDHAAAEAVAEATLEDLDALIAAGLIRREANGRLVLHDLVREAALRRLKQVRQERTVARLYLEHFLTVAEEAAPVLASAMREPWLKRLVIEDVNLQAALSWGLEHEPTLGVRLAAALAWYWYFRGALGEGRSWLERCLTLFCSDELARVRAEAGAGALAWAQGDHAAARGWLQSAVAVLHHSGDPRTLVHALTILTLTAHDQSDHDAAIQWAQRATAAARVEGDPWSLALALTAEGAARFGVGDLVGAEGALAESLRRWTELGDSWGIAMVLLNRGRIAFVKNAYAAATIYLEDGLARLRGAQDRRFSAAALLLLGEIARGQADLGLARARYAASLTAYEEVGTAWGVRLCLEALAATCASDGHFDHAARLLGAATAAQPLGAASRSQPATDPMQQLVASLDAALGAESYIAHFTAGQLLTPQQALAELS
ncbi:MAG: XRE family transcriptional regulator [Chloroflexi bacterium]|nr:XRE family transcriptional regulator [Chloroflexota bacterium]